MAQLAHNFGRAMCDALGIDHKLVQRFVFYVDATDVLRIEISLMPNISQDAFKAIGDALVADDKVVELVVSRPIVEAVSMNGRVEYVP